MNRTSSLTLAAILGTGLVLAGCTAARAQQAQAEEPQAAPQVSAEQQKQLEQLKQLEDQLQKDRDAVHAAITQYGWDSDQTDDAQAQLFRDREQYRRQRRSLRAAGVPVPPPAGLGRGASRAQGRRWAGRGLRAGRGYYGRGPCHCPCCGWW